jgi:hypothetical protein
VFQGTIPVEMRSIVAQHADTWPDGSDVHIGCSGNLTIERTLHSTVAHKAFKFHSNDINAYSCALGWHFAGQPVPYELAEDSRAELGWIEDYLDNGATTLAVIMLGTRFLQFVGNPGRYHQRMVAAHHDQFAELIRKTRNKIDAATLRLDSFYAGDVRDMLAQVPEEDPVVMFPPFYGSSDYEQMFAAIDKHFTWPTPTYRDLDEDGKDEIIAAVTDRPYWLLGLHVERDGLPLRGRVQTTNRGVPIHVYSSHGPRRLVRPRQASAPVPMRKIGVDEEVQGPLRLHPLTGPQFATLRSQYMNKSIKPGSPAIAVAVSAGGALVGAFALSPNNFDPVGVYMMSDFPVSWSMYPRLSKLIVLAAMTVESQTLAQRAMPRRLINISTTAYSDNPNSAKYGRGIPGFRLQRRLEPGSDGIHRYQLQYGGRYGQWTLDEALEMWLDKHSMTRPPAALPAVEPAEVQEATP